MKMTLCAAFLLLSASTLEAHARFKIGGKTPPRNASTGLKSGPCGGVARTAAAITHKPGETITVEWEETINHPGYFIIRFSPEGDKDFEKNILVEKFADTQNDRLMNGAVHSYSTTVKLPSVECESCTLQLIQHMDDAPDRPYFSCSDIKIKADPVTPVEPMPEPVTPDPVPVEPDPVETPPGEKALKPAKPTGVKLEKAK